MKREEKVIRYYVLCNKLKNVIRTGWLNWNVTKDRVESVAEHVYATQMLALAMYSEYEYELDNTILKNECFLNLIQYNTRFFKFQYLSL